LVLKLNLTTKNLLLAKYRITKPSFCGNFKSNGGKHLEYLFLFIVGLFEFETSIALAMNKKRIIPNEDLPKPLEPERTKTSEFLFERTKTGEFLF
jgi:hypothetical protein